MTRDEAVIEVRRILGFRGTDQNDNIVLAMRQAQRLLEMGRSLPWFLIEEDTTLTGTADVAYVALPTGFLREVDDEPWYFSMSGEDDVVKMKKMPWDWVQDAGRNPEDGEVEEGLAYYYALRKTRIYVRPVPTAAWTMVGSYYKAADTLDTASSNAWLTYAPELIYGSAALSMAQDLRDEKAEKKAREVVAIASASVLADTIQRELGNREIIMGGQA